MAAGITAAGGGADSMMILLHRTISAALVFIVQHGVLNLFLRTKKKVLNIPPAESQPPAGSQPPACSQSHSGVLAVLCSPKPNVASNRLVATTHALASIVLGLLWIRGELRPCGSSLGGIQRLAMQVSLGYFCYDLLFEIMDGGGYDMIVHHSFAVFGLAYGLMQDVSGTDVLGAIFCAELSTPLLHLRFFLRSSRATAQGQKWFDAVSLAFFIIFLMSRCLVLGPLVTYFTLVSPTTPLFIKVCGITLYVVSLGWGYFLIRLAVKKVKP